MSSARAKPVNLLELDLNLLRALDALLTERSVSHAAERLVRSQAALSVSLTRLRSKFGDELLIRVGDHYELTPFAAPIAYTRQPRVLDEIERIFAPRSNFDPPSSDRRFAILCSDSGLSLVGRILAEIVAAEAPNARLFSPLSDQSLQSGGEPLRYVDGVILPVGVLGDFPHLELRWRDVDHSTDGLLVCSRC